jgi:hypothetical protein
MRLTAIALSFSAFAWRIYARGNSGMMTGDVSHPQGAVVASAAMEAKRLETSVVFTEASSATGNYALSQLLPVTYELTAVAPGFKKYIWPNIVIESAQTYSDYRYQRRPAESMPFGREFRIEERASLQVPAEFTNIFNRLVLPNPAVSNIQATTTYNAAGLMRAGFGFGFSFINDTNGAGSMPRSSTLIAEISF